MLIPARPASIMITSDLLDGTFNPLRGIIAAIGAQISPQASPDEGRHSLILYVNKNVEGLPIRVNLLFTCQINILD